jgi:hypothetical protein
VVERALEAVVLPFDVTAGDVLAAFRLIEDAREVEALRLPVLDALAGVEQVGAADQVVELAMPSCAMISRTSSATKKK